MMKKMNSIAAFLLSAAVMAGIMNVCAFADESAATGVRTVYGVVTAVEGENITIALAPTRKDDKDGKRGPKNEAEKPAEGASGQTETRDGRKALAPMQKGDRPDGKNAPEMSEKEPPKQAENTTDATSGKAPEKPEALEAKTLTFQLTDRTEIIRNEKNVLTTVEKNEIAEHDLLRITLDGTEAISVQFGTAFQED